ncbi:MAG TPA: hypothetical protein ENG51_06630, partial [Deltaproteobacteria bacterium]|nr:hypothetical protein [Deltaproteobacteria bacterium]
MKSKIVTLLLTLVFICCLSLSSYGLPVELIENGGFETGTFSGWDLYVNTQVQTDEVYKGKFAAGLSVSESVPSQTCWWKIGCDTNPCSAFLAQELNGFSNTDQKLTVSFAYNVKLVINLSKNANDRLFAGLVGWNGNIYAQLLLATNGYTEDWVFLSKDFDLSGLGLNRVFLAFYFADSPCCLGSLDISSAFIDEVSVTANPVPEP